MSRMQATLSGVAIGLLLFTGQAAPAGASPGRVYDATISADSSGLFEDDVAVYELKEVEARGEGVEVLAQIPDGCRVGDNSSFVCEGISRKFRAVVTDSSGSPLPHSLTTDVDGLVVTIPDVAELVLVGGIVSADADHIHSMAMEYISSIAAVPKDDNSADPLSPLGMTSPVTVPGGYIYCPYVGCRDRTLHDYCSYSPDYWGSADFRGPCAYHDMDIDRIRSRSITLDAKRSARRVADSSLITRMQYNCRWYYAGNGAVTPCIEFTLIYKAAVNARTASWNGR